MNIGEFCIKRPALTIVISLLFIVLGATCYLKLPLRYLPDYTVPVISISTDYPAASSDIVESQVTAVLEDAMQGVPGLKFISSQSTNGNSQIVMTFKLGTDLNVAAEDVRSNVAKVTSQLPSTIQPPVVSKTDPNAAPVLFFAYADPNESIGVLTDYVKKFIVPQFETSTGVAKVLVWSSQFYAMRIWLDPAKMAATGVTVSDVENVINNQNIAVPTGTLENNQLLYNVTTDMKLHNANEFGNLVIKHENNSIVRLSDIATIAVGDEHRTSDTIMRYFAVNGNPGVAIGIIPEEGANNLVVTSEAVKLSQHIAQQLPAGLTQIIEYNQSDFTQADIESIYTAIIEAVIFIIAVVILFLGNWKAALIPIITIPVSLIGTFAIIFLIGFSINTLTLLALVLAVGLVVDDAIIMVENISRFIENGSSPLDAAIQGSAQITLAIIAVTLVLVAAYAPAGFMPGVSGVFFREFAFTLLAAVLISGVIALTLSPLMCARFFRQQHDSRYQHYLNEKFEVIKGRYMTLLNSLLYKKVWVLVGIIIAIGVGISTFFYLPKELAPSMDMPLINVWATLPAQNSFSKTESFIPVIQNTLNEDKNIAAYLTQVWQPDTIYIAVALKSYKQRALNSYQIANILQSKLSNIPGVLVNVSSAPPPLTWGNPSLGLGDLGVNIMTTASYKQLHDVMINLVNEVKKNPQLINPDTELKWNTQQINIHVNRDLVSDLNIPMNDVTDTLAATIGGLQVGKYDFEGQNYDVIMQLPPTALQDINILDELYVRNKTDQMVPLSNFVTTTQNSAPATLTHFNRLRSDTLTVSFAQNYSMGQAVNYFKKLFAETLPDNVTYSFTGQAQQYLESNNSMIGMFCLAILLVYLILAAQFENFIDPLIIISSVPFAIIGAFVTLKITGNSLNLYSEIGLITLIGLITKHGILITEFANQLVKQAYPLHKAILEAAVLRLRPILMTTLAMILGAIPLAFAMGPGSENRQQIAWVIIGGLLIGTFISLIIIPVFYYAINILRQQKPEVINHA